MTREHAKIIAPLLAAYAEGKTIQFYARSKNQWRDYDMNHPLNPTIRDHRIKPEPKRVPLTSKDVPPGSVFRSIVNNPEGSDLWFIPLFMAINGIGLQGGVVLPWRELENYYEIRRPGEDWKPCWKEVTE